MRVLITGGTGTLGQALVQVLKCDITVISRSEVKQVEMREKFPDVEYKICDIRDYKALRKIIRGMDVVYHLAALKHVPICQKQPLEAEKTNLQGTKNVIKCGCPVVFMSTDKAELPTNVYGLTKALAEAYVLDSGGVVIRTGNIFGSSGSVIPLFVRSVLEKNEINLTCGEMTRFFISAKELAEFTIQPHEGLVAAETSSYRMIDIAEAVKELYGDDSTKINVTGIRPGEKMHETLLGKSSLDCLGSYDDLLKLFNEWSPSS